MNDPEKDPYLEQKFLNLNERSWQDLNFEVVFLNGIEW